MKKRIQRRPYLWMFIFFLIGGLTVFLVNNFWPKPEPYNFISCTWNKYSCDASSGGLSGGGSSGGDSNDGCDCPDWDGVCNDVIRNECCRDTTTYTCSGQVAKPSDCTYKTCEYGRCGAIYDTGQNIYTCQCGIG